MAKGYSINGIDADASEFWGLYRLLQEGSGRDLQDYGKDHQLSHQELLDILDVDRDGKYDFGDRLVSNSLFDSEQFQRILGGLDHFNFNLDREAGFHQDDLVQRQEQEAIIKKYSQRFPVGCLVKMFIDNGGIPRWPEAITRISGVRVGRVVGRPNDPPCEDKDFYHRGPDEPIRDIALQVDWGKDNPWGSYIDCVSTEIIEKASEGDVSIQQIERNYLSPDLFGYTPILNFTGFAPVTKDRIESGEELAGGLTFRGGVAFHYPKRADVSAFLLLGAQTLSRWYGPKGSQISRGHSGPLFGAGITMGDWVTLDPVVMASPVFSHQDGTAHLLWGAGVHSTWFGMFGLNAGCEKLGSAFMCGGGVGLAIAAQNNDSFMGGW